jgi:hypothetical protein
MLNFIKRNTTRPDTYICQCCQQSKQLNESNFEIVKKFKYGFSTCCLDCIKLMNVKKERKK